MRNSPDFCLEKQHSNTTQEKHLSIGISARQLNLSQDDRLAASRQGKFGEVPFATMASVIGEVGEGDSADGGHWEDWVMVPHLDLIDP